MNARLRVLSLMAAFAVVAAFYPAWGRAGAQGPSAGPPITWNDSSPRNVDDRQLNAFGSEFMGLDPKSPRTPAHLNELAARVEGFHQALFTRKYNAMDILKDTEDLQKRIDVARSKYGPVTKVIPVQSPAPRPIPRPAPPAPVPSVTPSTQGAYPPGALVTFPNDPPAPVSLGSPPSSQPAYSGPAP